MGTRNRVGIGLSYRPARLHRMAESIPWFRFMGSLDVFPGIEPESLNVLPGIDSQAGGIDPLESISGLLERLQIRAQYTAYARYRFWLY
jgi:hypothetical protein